jgi:hypothetical protein
MAEWACRHCASIGLTHASLPTEKVKHLGDAMLVLGVGSLCGLASALFAYIGRTFRLERPTLIGWRRPIRWLAILAAIAGAVCFIGALNMVRAAVPLKEAPTTSTGTAQPESPAANTPKLLGTFDGRRAARNPEPIVR